MKTKGEEKKKDEKKKEARRKRLCLELNTGPPTIRGQSFPTGPRGKRTGICGNFIIKTFKSY